MRESPDSPLRRSTLPEAEPRRLRRNVTPTSRRHTIAAVSSDAPRSRLPPRSRAGCWTCRARKVKCDEGRPVCSQCDRLGHSCDYNPRLSFRHDTSRILERMQEVRVAGSGVWDRPSTATHVGVTSSQLDDSLPPFADLTTDEDRERKAELTKPGTYHVVVNPDSFLDTPEYQHDESSTRSESMGLSRDFRKESSAGSFRPSQLVAEDSNDPNVIILRRFEDNSIRLQAPQPRDGLPQSPTTEFASFTPITPSTEESSVPNTSKSNLQSPGEELSFNARHGHLFAHFRDFVWPRLIQITHDRYDDGLVIFEEEALRFPPFAVYFAFSSFHDSGHLDYESITNRHQELYMKEIKAIPSGIAPICLHTVLSDPGSHILYYAVCALAALSLACKGQSQQVDALQHYEEAIQSIPRSPIDFANDGYFFCHYLLLVYEVAAAEHWGMSMWSQHLTQLLEIVLRRQQMPTNEPYPFLVWWIAQIDIYALLTGKGSGEFVSVVLQNNLFPDARHLLPPLQRSSPSTFYPGEQEVFPPVLEFVRDATVAAASLGQLSREIRAETSSTTHTSKPALASSFVRRQTQLLRIQENLKGIWKAHNAAWVSAVGPMAAHNLPERVQASLEQACSLYHACLLFSYTSMWPSQRVDTGRPEPEEIEEHVSKILSLAGRIVQEQHLERRFIVFPVFMAGFASSVSASKSLALALLAALQPGEIGRNTTTATRLLTRVYELQNQSPVDIGLDLSVDWIDVMNEERMHVVCFGL